MTTTDLRRTSRLTPLMLALVAACAGDKDSATCGPDEVLVNGVCRPEQDGPGAVDRRHARIDIGRVLERLTPVQRQLCQMLGAEGLTIKEAAERLRIPRGTLYEEIKRIRKVFADQGLGDYLKD